jgi:hypothetical protein
MEIPEDNRLFNKLGLLKTLHLNLNCSVEDFRTYFQSNVGTGQTFVGIKKPQYEFQGTVGRRAFKIHRSLTMIDSNLAIAGASGIYEQSNGKTKIQLWVYLPIGTFLILSLMILAISILVVTLAFSIDNIRENIWLSILIPLIFIILWTLLPYFSIRNSIQKFAFDLERELNYWTIKQTSR